MFSCIRKFLAYWSPRILRLTLTSEELAFYGRRFVCVKHFADFIEGINKISCIETCIIFILRKLRSIVRRCKFVRQPYDFLQIPCDSNCKRSQGYRMADVNKA